MHDQLIDVVAAVHAVDWEAHGLGAVLPGTRLRDAVERWVAYVDWSSEGDPLPALAQSLDWCARHVPDEREPVLLWGDVRLGNLVFDPERRVTAVLDWDLASLGPREMDLGWHFGLEFMMEALFGGRPPGFPGTAEVLERYERRSGYEARDLAVARGLRTGARLGHQRPPPAHHRGHAPPPEPDGRHPAGAPGGSVRGRRLMRAAAPGPVQRQGSRSEKPMTPAFATS